MPKKTRPAKKPRTVPGVHRAASTKKHALWVTDADLFHRFKAMAAERRQRIADATAEAIGLYVKQYVRVPPVKDMRKEKAAVDELIERGDDPFVTESFGPPINTEMDVCRRCGHAAFVHWARGCVGTCTCTAGRYLKPKE